MTSNAASTPPVTTVHVPSARRAASTIATDVEVESVPAGTSSDATSGAGSDRDGATAAEKPAAPTPAAPTPAAPTPAASTPAASTPAASTPAASTPAAPTPAAEKPPVETSSSESPAAESRAAEKAGADGSVPPSEVELGPDPAGLHERMVEARERLRPEGPVIPAPRSPQGVTVPPPLGAAAKQPGADIVAAIDEVVADLAAVRANLDDPVHHALARLGELSTGAIPDAGWSRDEDLDPEDVAAAADLSAELHSATAAVVERLDAEELASSAVVVDSVTTSLQVMRMIADLEIFARTRG